MKKGDLLSSGAGGPPLDGKMHIDLRDNPIRRKIVAEVIKDHDLRPVGKDPVESANVEGKPRDPMRVKLSPNALFRSSVGRAVMGSSVHPASYTTDVDALVDAKVGNATVKVAPLFDTLTKKQKLSFLRHPEKIGIKPTWMQTQYPDSGLRALSPDYAFTAEDLESWNAKIKEERGGESGDKLRGFLESAGLWKNGVTAREITSLFDAKIDESKARIKVDEEFLTSTAIRDELMALDPAKQVLRKNDVSVFHKALEGIRQGFYIPLDNISREQGLLLRSDVLGAFDQEHVIFVVKHDWAQAFAKAKDFDGGDFHFPAPICAFEFMIGEHRVVFSGSMDVDTPSCLVMMQSKHKSPDADIQCWALLGAYGYEHGHWCGAMHKHMPPGVQAMVNAVFDQVRAIMIALEAQVAETEIVRAPHRLNAQRERKGKLPLLDYHVVNLANRVRYAPRAAEPGDIDVEHARKRLHFVRAHWRHYPNHKVPIKWHLRGDPDLGFIDKHYKL